MAKTVTVELNKRELQVLRRLFVEEYRRLNYEQYQRPSDMPSKLKRMRSVAWKIYIARQEIDVKA